MSEDQVRRLWGEAAQLPHNARKVEVLEEAVRESDQCGWEFGSHQSRMQLMQTAELSGHGDRVLVAFSWCLAKSDEQPSLYPDVELLWNYKWAIYNSFLFPSVERPRLEALLDDYAARLERNGYSSRPAIYLRMQYQFQCGDPELALETLEGWPHLPRDRFADCPACELDNRVHLYCCLGEDEKAHATAAPLLAHIMTCAEIPQLTFGRLMVGSLRSQTCDPESLFLQGYTMCQGDLAFLAPIGLLALHLARQNDAETQRLFLAQHLRLAENARNPRDLLDFYAGAVAVAAAIGDEPSIGSKTGAQLASELTLRATDLGAKFDARNGNQWVSQNWRSQVELGRP